MPMYKPVYKPEFNLRHNSVSFSFLFWHVFVEHPIVSLPDLIYMHFVNTYGNDFKYSIKPSSVINDTPNGISTLG